MRHMTGRVCLAMLLLVIYVSSATPAAAPAPVRTQNWPDAQTRGRWTDDGGLDESTAWDNELGDWGVTAKMSNYSSSCHRYHFTYEFGHMESGRPETFVPYFLAKTETIELCGHQAQGIARGSGSQEEHIRSNFNSINATRRTMTQEN